jgi:hypothetical protein
MALWNMPLEIIKSARQRKSTYYTQNAQDKLKLHLDGSTLSRQKSLSSYRHITLTWALKCLGLVGYEKSLHHFVNFLKRLANSNLSSTTTTKKKKKKKTIIVLIVSNYDKMATC